LPLDLIDNPEAGDVEPGTAGLRRIRLGDPTRGKGKRGGARPLPVAPPSGPHLSDVRLWQKRGEHVDDRSEKETREVVAQINAADSPKE
jgi:hypothetical protein